MNAVRVSSGFGSIVLLAAGAVAFFSEPPIEPAIALFAGAAALGGVGVLSGRGSLPFVVLNLLVVAAAAVALLLIRSLMTN
jgi:hypothetical protein